MSLQVGREEGELREEGVFPAQPNLRSRGREKGEVGGREK